MAAKVAPLIVRKMNDSSVHKEPRRIGPEIATARIERNTYYLKDRSRPEAGFYLWSYQVTIAASDTLEGTLKLVGRHWDYGNGDAPLNGATLAGQHPQIDWQRPVFRYRSATAFAEPIGQIGGYIWGELNGEPVQIPVGTFVFDLKAPHKGGAGGLYPGEVSKFELSRDLEALNAIIEKYNGDIQRGEGATIVSRDFPKSVRYLIEDYVFKSLNKKKYSEYDLSAALGVTGDAAIGLKFWTSDVFADASIDDPAIIFLYKDMDLIEYIDLTEKFANSDEVLRRSELRAAFERFQRELASVLALPEHAPRLYEDRPDKNQNIIDFLSDEEGWGPYIKRGVLTRPALLKRDKKAYQALTNWLRNPKHQLPADMNLPSKSETLKVEVADEDQVRAARRLLSAHLRRHRYRDPTPG